MKNFRDDKKRKKKTTTKPKRKRRKSLPFQKRVQLFFINLFNGLIALMVVAAVVFIGWRLYAFLFTSSYFALKSFDIQGVNEELAQEIRNASGIDVEQHPNMLTISRSALKKHLLKNPKLRTVTIRKIYPSRMIIGAEKRIPVAIVNAERMYLVDMEGYVTDRISGAVLGSYNVPFITGIDQKYLVPGNKIGEVALYRALDLMLTLEENNKTLFSRLSEIHIDESRNITTFFTGGTEIRCGKYSPVEILPNLEAFLTRMKDIKRVDYIDLRFNKQVVYKPR